jgi:hypothetical protein
MIMTDDSLTVNNARVKEPAHFESITFPTAGQRFVQAHFVRNEARREAKVHRQNQQYHEENNDPRSVGSSQAAAELWEKLVEVAQAEKDLWREEAKACGIDVHMLLGD